MMTIPQRGKRDRDPPLLMAISPTTMTTVALMTSRPPRGGRPALRVVNNQQAPKACFVWSPRGFTLL